MAPGIAGCAQCLPPDPQEAARRKNALAEQAVLVDESHFRMRVLACAGCGQRFLSVFTELIDWVDGEDPQHWSILPLLPDEADALLAAGTSLVPAEVERLGVGRRMLEIDHPKSGGLSHGWGVGPLLIGPHD